MSRVRTSGISVADQSREVKFSEIVSGLSFVLDMVEGQPEGHSLRSCFIGMQVGKRLGLSEDQLSSLFYALLVKDAGCSSNAARVTALFGAEDFGVKRAFKMTDWSRLPETVLYAARSVRPGGTLWAKARQFVVASKGGPKTTGELIKIRCDRGAEIARAVGFSEDTANAIRSLDEHWDGGGYPDGLKKEEIPLLARICSFAQTMEVFSKNLGMTQAEHMARERRRRWFDPEVVDAFLSDPTPIWESLSRPDLTRLIFQMEPYEKTIHVTPELLDVTAVAFARIIDAKSPYTYQHSDGVAKAAVAVARRLGFDDEETRELWRAALLHDIGKLSIPNTILDKPGKLTDDEFARIKEHPRLTYEALVRIPILDSIAVLASRHHEKLDGSGYHLGISGDEMTRADRILAVADIYDALAQDRPYRPAMPMEKVVGILRLESETKLCPESVEVMVDVIEGERLDEEASEGMAWL